MVYQPLHACSKQGESNPWPIWKVEIKEPVMDGAEKKGGELHAHD
jgi:hypothetical protein